MIEEQTENRKQRVAIWSTACRLQDAWIKFGGEREKKLQAKTRGTPASSVYMENMTAEVFGQITDGELVAFGYRTAPTISDGPVVIFEDVFSEPSREGWLEGAVQASGWRYERVRVLKLHVVESMLSSAARILDASQPALTNISAGPSFPIIATSERRKPGPRSGQAELRRRYEYLLMEGSIAKKHTVKEALRAVVRSLESDPSDHFPREAGLAYSTFARAISTKSRP